MPVESHAYNTILYCHLCRGPWDLVRVEPGGRRKSYKGPKKKRGPDIIKSERLLANARRCCSRKTLLIFRGFGPGTMAGPVPPSLPHSLAWQRCHREHQTNGWRDRKGRRDVEEEKNKRIVLRVEKGVLWTRQIAYVGEWGGGRERGARKDRERWNLAFLFIYFFK